MKRIVSVSWLAMLLLQAALAQTAPIGSLRVQCVKARDGKDAELRAFLMDSTVKLARLRVQNGTYTSFVIAEAVAPAGRAARCDYHVVYGTSGAPMEPLRATDEDLKKAGIAMSAAQRNTKRDQLSQLISIEYWQTRDFVGTPMKGGYARLNYFKTKPSEQAEWIRMEQGGWKQLAESLAKETPGRAWGLYSLGMPGGTSLPYNALTVDIAPNWASMFSGVNSRQTWMKVHPESDFSGYMNRVGQLAERPMVNTMRLLEVIQK